MTILVFIAEALLLGSHSILQIIERFVSLPKPPSGHIYNKVSPPSHIARPAACFLYYYSVYVIVSKNASLSLPAFCRKRVQRYAEIFTPARLSAIIFWIFSDYWYKSSKKVVCRRSRCENGAKHQRLGYRQNNASNKRNRKKIGRKMYHILFFLITFAWE